MNKTICQNCDSKNQVKKYQNGDDIKYLCCYCADIFGKSDNITLTMSAMFNTLEKNLKKEMKRYVNDISNNSKL